MIDFLAVGIMSVDNKEELKMTTIKDIAKTGIYTPEEIAEISYILIAPLLQPVKSSQYPV